jgi:PAS domain S-box-containing protein
MPREPALRGRLEVAMNDASSRGLFPERMRLMLERIPDVIWTVDSGLRLVFLSPAWERITDFKVDECCRDGGRTCLDFAHPDDRPEIAAAFDALFTRGVSFDREWRARGKGDEWIWVRLRAVSTYELDGRRCADGLLTDITERRNALAATSESEERLRLALDASRMGTYDWDVVSGRVTWSRWHEALWGFAPGEFDGRYQTFMSRVHPDDAPGVAAEDARSQAARDRCAQEFRVVWPDGSIRWIAGVGEFSFDDAGQPVRMRGVVREVTESKRAELELRGKTAFLEALVASSPDGMLVVDGEGKQILQNARFREVFGLPPEVADDQDDERQLQFALRLIKDPTGFMEKIRHLYTHPAESSWDEVEFADGRILERYSSPVLGATGTLFGRIWTFRDVTERRRNETALRESEARLRRLYSSIRDAYCEVDMDGRVADVNDTFAGMLGYDKAELVGRKFNDITPERWRAMGDGPIREQVIGRGYSDVFEKEYERKDGSVFPVELRIFLQRGPDGTPESMWAVVRDITQRKREEAELRESEERFSAAFRRSPALMVISRLSDGLYLEVNQAFEQCTGYTRDEVVGQTRGEVGLWASPSHMETAMRALRERGEFATLQTPMRFKSGNVRIMRLSGAAIELAGERCALTVGEDVTELARAESEVLELNAALGRRVAERTAELEQANRALHVRAAELDTFNRAMIGREKRVIELKEEVNQLCARMRLPSVYEPVWREPERE